MIQDILTAIPLGIFLSFLIGPVFFVLLETSVIKGFRAALVFDIGVIVADIIFIFIAFFSSVRLIETIKDDPSIFIFGGILMGSYGLVSFLRLRKIGRNVKTEEDITVEDIKKNYRNLFFKGFLLNFINFGVLLFWFMIIITVGPKLDLDISRLVTFFGSVLGTYLFVDIGKILLAKQLKRKMTPKNIFNIKKVISVLLIIFGVVIMMQGFFPQDQEMVREVLDVILGLARQGMTMVMVTHEMGFARAVADRIVFIDEGKICEMADPSEFFTNPRTERAQQFLNIFQYQN